MGKTIAAISTPMMAGGIGIIRISGENSQIIADRIFRSISGKKISDLKGYTALFGHIVDEKGENIDEVVALNFLAPKSFTGENTVELSCHGGIYVMKKILETVLSAGAVIAEAGEFTKLAFLNGKMDLAQAESVMDLISAQGKQAARAALSAKDGALSKKIMSIKDNLVDLGAHLSAWADYPDDDIPQVDDNMLKVRLGSAKEEIEKLLATFDSGKVLREGVVTVIAGRPNAGKSTLMNLLTGCERSIVTHFAGTTRDVVEETIMLGDIPLRLADTAGIRETDDPVESIGVNLAMERLTTAQLVLAVFDASSELTDDDIMLTNKIKDIPTIAVINKTDLSIKMDEQFLKDNFKYIVYISALNGNGVDELKGVAEEIFKTNQFDSSAGMLFTERQRDDAKNALEAVEEAMFAFQCGFTLDAITVSVEGAVSSLLELTGERVSDTVIDSVFEKFCVGK